MIGFFIEKIFYRKLKFWTKANSEKSSNVHSWRLSRQTQTTIFLAVSLQSVLLKKAGAPVTTSASRYILLELYVDKAPTLGIKSRFSRRAVRHAHIHW